MILKQILLTGMSATGQSTLGAEPAARGYRAVDMDRQANSYWVAVVDEEGSGA